MEPRQHQPDARTTLQKICSRAMAVVALDEWPRIAWSVKTSTPLCAACVAWLCPSWCGWTWNLWLCHFCKHLNCLAREMPSTPGTRQGELFIRAAITSEDGKPQLRSPRARSTKNAKGKEGDNGPRELGPREGVVTPGGELVSRRSTSTHSQLIREFSPGDASWSTSPSSIANRDFPLPEELSLLIFRIHCAKTLQRCSGWNCTMRTVNDLKLAEEYLLSLEWNGQLGRGHMSIRWKPETCEFQERLIFQKFCTQK